MHFSLPLENNKASRCQKTHVSQSHFPLWLRVTRNALPSTPWISLTWWQHKWQNNSVVTDVPQGDTSSMGPSVCCRSPSPQTLKRLPCYGKCYKQKELQSRGLILDGVKEGRECSISVETNIIRTARDGSRTSNSLGNGGLLSFLHSGIALKQ